MVKSESPSVTIVDGASLFDAAEIFSERFARKVSIDYTALKVRLDRFRIETDWRPAVRTDALLSVDRASEGQQRFMSMLTKAGFDPYLVPYREAFVSLPPGRSPAEMTAKPITSFAARIAYVAGLMARHADPHVIVVSHAFELQEPLVDLAARVPNGRVGLAYFGSLLDYRWKAAGLSDDKLPIRFFDLDDHGLELIGVELTAHRQSGEVLGEGLARY